MNGNVAGGFTEGGGAAGTGIAAGGSAGSRRAPGLARLAAVVLWLLVGHLALGGAYWTLLTVPESNAIMLIASALLVVLLTIAAAIVETTGLLWLRPEWGWRASFARSLRALPAFVLAVLVWVIVCTIALQNQRYHELYGTQLDAWLIASFDITRATWLHRAIDYVLWFVEWVVGTSLAVALLNAAATGSFADIFRLRWIPRGLHWRPLLVITLAMLALIWQPWRGVYWRPASLPASSAEVAFTVAKLLILGLVMHVGWALVLWSPQSIARRARPGTPAPVAPATPGVAP